MFNLPDADDVDDDTTDLTVATDNSDTPDTPRRVNAAEALAVAALEAALTRESRADLRRSPSVIIVKVPTAAWPEIIKPVVRSMERAPMVRTVTERVKQSGTYHRVGGEDLRYLRRGKSVLYISQDPDELLDEAVLAAADVTISVAPVTPALLRKVIRRVTRRISRGVTADMAALDLPVITSVVRPELTARECVENLRRAVKRKPEPPVSSVPLLSVLPLTENVRTWTEQTLSDLAAVEAGAMPPQQLVFGMLEGPPGTGKTLIAESLARTAGWTFVPSSVGAWFTSGDGALGGVAQNLKSFIDHVMSAEPAIGFMDELDALPDRATMDNRAREWWTTIINLFLTEIDRLRKSGKKVLLIGATNYYDRLDAALVRPGRLQQRISVLPPRTEAEVIAVMRYYLGDDLADADLGKLGRIGRGATPALVEGWVKEARAEARSRNRPLELNDILVRMVPKDDRTHADIRTTAIHEAGHAVVAHRLGRTVGSVSILPAGDAGGVTVTRLPTLVPTWDDLCDTITVTLGGRAADIVLGNGPNAGAEADLADATTTVRNAYERHGLHDSLAYAPALGIQFATPLKTVNAELDRLLTRAIAIVEADDKRVLDLADRLIEDKVLSGNEVAQVLGSNPRHLVPKGEARAKQADTPPPLPGPEARHGRN